MQNKYMQLYVNDFLQRKCFFFNVLVGQFTAYYKSSIFFKLNIYDTKMFHMS